jgi:hypothetical protein
MPKSQPFEYVDRDIRRDEILTQDGYGILVRALTVVVGRAETAEIMAWSAHSGDRDHSFRRIATTRSDRSRPV